MSPEFSVIIPTRGDSPHLRAAVFSALANDADLEILVVHDRRSGSAALERDAFDDARIRVLASHAAGPAAARNAGMRAARGTHLAFLDDDDLWLPVHLTWASETIRLHPEAVLVTSDAWIFEDGTEDGSLTPGEGIDRLPRFRPDLAGGPLPLHRLVLANPILTPAVVLVRGKLSPSDQFDERLGVLEDQDLWLRLTARGALVFDQRPGILVRRRPGSASCDWRAMAEGSIEVLHRALATERVREAVSAAQARRRLGILWRELAYACLLEGDLAAARRALRESITRLPLWPKNYIYWLASALPARLRQGVFARGGRIRARNTALFSPRKASGS